jgi:broad specificity phosphatase PhoE
MPSSSIAPKDEENQTRTVIYVRHGHDTETNFIFDEKLTSYGKKAARKKAKYLIKKYGVPDVIFSSPFSRTRATLREFVKVCNDYKRKRNISPETEVRVAVDARLGRFFTSNDRREYKQAKKEHKKNLRRSTTALASKLIDKNKYKFRERVEDQFKDIANYTLVSPEENIVWNITHSLVLLHVARMNKKKFPSHVNFLDHLTLRKK